MNLKELLARIESKTRSKAVTTGAGWKTLCPAHDDKNPSLSVSEGNDGRILLNCHTGCHFDKVVLALGLKASDLGGSSRQVAKDPAGKASRIVATYSYADAGGKVLFEVCRFEPKTFRQRRPDPAAPGGWVWKGAGAKRVLFRLPELLAAVKAGETIFVGEGEKDVLALVKEGFVATCNSGGAGKWLSEYNEPLRGASVVVIADKDDPGRAHAADVANKLKPLAKSVKVLELPDVERKAVKDASDFFANGGTGDKLRQLVAQAPEHGAAAGGEAPPPPVFFHGEKGDYWRQRPDGVFAKCRQDDLMRHLAVGGFKAHDHEGPFSVKKSVALIVRIQNESTVEHVIPLSGHRAGLFRTEGGLRVLIPSTGHLIHPVAGCTENFDRFFSEFFGQDQVPTVLSWLKISLEDRHGQDPERWRHHQMLALVGKPNCGKSFFQGIVTLLLGGREADPYLWMVQKTDFNEDLAEAEHWKMEDKNAHRDAKSRANFGGAIKQAAVSHTLAVHGKGKKQILLPCFRRLTLSINDDPEYITVLPTLDDSVADKITILKCNTATMLPDWKANRARFLNELPAFVHFLRNTFKIPEEIRDSRYGVKTYHAPEIIELLAQFDPHLQLLEVIDASLFGAERTVWTGLSAELQKELCAGIYEMKARQLLNYSSQCGVLLGKLAKARPDRVTMSRIQGNNKWTIRPPR